MKGIIILQINFFLVHKANPPVLRTRLFVSEHVCMYTKYTCIHASALVSCDVVFD